MNENGSVSLSVKVNFNAQSESARLAGAVHRAQMKLDSQVLADSNYYCPLYTGTLQKSAIINTVLGSGEIVWRTPYAREQYYGLNFDHSKSNNLNACAMWFEAAKARKEKDWIRLVESEIERG
ncbi:MAG: minor capsid protein [Treponema sp.]|nr:minor capsid protein [Treponema sp.]